LKENLEENVFPSEKIAAFEKKNKINTNKTVLNIDK